MSIPASRIVFTEDDVRAVQERVGEVLRTGQLAQGKYVAELERSWAAYAGAKHAVAVNSGSSAVEIPMRIFARSGDEVLVPVNTFAATAIAVRFAGADVRFVDTDPATFGVSLAALRARRTPRTRGVVVVHIGGIVTPEMPEIRSWCDAEGLWLVEDCAHAHGSATGERHAGTFGAAGAFSFFATKVMTSGEGGMIVTDDDGVAEQARLLRNHGKPQPWVSVHTHPGGNWRMSEVHAVIALQQLARLDAMIESRAAVAALYARALEGMPELTPVLPAGRSGWYKFIVLLPPGVDRARVRADMAARGVSLSGGVYDVPLHRQPLFEEEEAEQSYPIADDVCARHVCLPMFPGMTSEEGRRVIDALREAIALQSQLAV